MIKAPLSGAFFCMQLGCVIQTTEGRKDLEGINLKGCAMYSRFFASL